MEAVAVLKNPSLFSAAINDVSRACQQPRREVKLRLKTLFVVCRQAIVEICPRSKTVILNLLFQCHFSVDVIETRFLKLHQINLHYTNQAFRCLCLVS